MKPGDPNINTYNQIAAIYQSANQNRGMIADQLEKFIVSLPNKPRVLDLGCGPGFDTFAMRKNGLQAIGFDLAMEMLRIGHEKYAVPLVQADLFHIPVSRVDGVWACASLLHLNRADMPAALKEIARVLTPDGIFYLSLKWGKGSDWKEKSYREKAPRYFTYWLPETIDPLLSAAGFTIYDGCLQTGFEDAWLVRFARRSAE